MVINGLTFEYTRHPVAAQLIELTMRNNLEYHNGRHLQAMYSFITRKNVDYCAELDIAIAGHDCVYDNAGNLERRSADLVLSLINLLRVDVDTNLVERLIMSTKDHKFVFAYQDSILLNYMILADLHELANIESADRNYELIKQESTKLYNISEQKFYENNLAFMRKLWETISPYEHRIDLVQEIMFGIESTIRRSETHMQSYAYRQNDILNQLKKLWDEASDEVRQKFLDN